ncbi:MAG: VWA domain-containing protein [Phycisphaeraceae bacterium]|nr:VWA domain-containing protein [Phycisphaeraceae bacterium]MBX3367998.1 VWA domain-containing protein [Phycisphaeraceae bacterium]QYK48093.1 MAG: VWA domain-containing protein [Phycisphaeraceae bacterium]
MTWLTPWVGAIAAAVAIPALLILYFLKLRRRDVEVSTTLLWKKAIQDLQANAPFQRLRRNLLLLLQLIVLAAALFALAQPQFKGATTKGQRHIILIDRSASMQSLDAPSPSGAPRPVQRLEAAKKEAIDLIESLREANAFQPNIADEAMVIAFDTTAEVVANFTSDKGALKRAVESIAATDGGSLLEEAMRLAQAHAPRRVVEGQAIEGLIAGEPVTMHLWSDGAIADASRILPGVENEVVYHAVGQEVTANIGITSIRAERDFENPTRLAVYISLQSCDDRERTLDVELTIDGVVAGVKTVTLPATERTPEITPEAAEAGKAPDRPAAATGGVVFALDLPQGAVITARLRTGGDDDPRADVLRVDDRASIIVPPAKRLSVAIVTRGNLFIQAALGGLPLARLVTFTPEQFQQEIDARRSREFDVVILDSWLPRLPQGETLPPGRWLVFNAVPGGTLGLIDDGPGDSALFVDWAREHPVMRGLVLDNAVIAESRRVRIPEGNPVAVLATMSTGPSITEIITPEARAIVVPFDIAQTTWPFDVSFVVFSASAVTYLGADGSDPSTLRMLRPGGVLADAIPLGASDPVLIEPDQRETPLVLAPDNRITFGPIRRAGLYQVRWSGSATDPGAARPLRTYAANMTDAFESDVRAHKRLVLASRTIASDQQGKVLDRRLWPWLLLAALAVLMFEWYVYNRKVYY